jgi:hypothetical protein
MSVINKILRVVTVLPGILFVVIGVGWIIDPASALVAVPKSGIWVPSS